MELLEKTKVKNSNCEVYYFKNWQLGVELSNDKNIVDVYFRGQLLAEYDLINKTIYTRELERIHFQKCWYNWENEARIGICKYYHIRPKRKLLSELQVTATPYSEVYGKCSYCNGNIMIINCKDQFCPVCHKSILNNKLE